MTAVEAEQVDVEQPDAMRFLAGREWEPAEVASALGLSVGQVRRVLAPRVDAKPKGSRPVGRPRALTIEQVAQAARLRAEGMSYPAIGQALGVNRETVRLALQRAARPADAADPAPDAPAAAHNGSAPATAPPLTWPPPLTEPCQWVARPLRGGGSVRLRPVPLAGRVIEIDADGQLFCDDCLSMFSIEQVLRLTTREHRVGLARHPGALVQPLTDRDHGAPWVERWPIYPGGMVIHSRWINLWKHQANSRRNHSE
jgi:hypothetical protein